MRVSDRLDLISKIGRELQDRYTFDELYSYLRAFGIPQLDDGPTNSTWSYTKAALDPQPNERILEIAEDLELAAPTPVAVSGLPRNWRNTGDVRLFISHIAKHKDKATRLKEALAPHSICGFVAHGDIHPTLEWQQEIGFALGRGTKVISLKMGEDPTGFISKHQALPRRSRRAEEIAAEIKTLFLDDPKTKTRLERAMGLPGSDDCESEIPF